MTESITDIENHPVAAAAATGYASESEVERAVGVTNSRKWDVDRRLPLVPDRGLAARFWDSAGREYLDLTSCTGAAPLGIGYQPVIDAFVAEMRRSGGVLPGLINPLRTQVAELLVDTFPAAERVLFFRTGSCATSGAVRLARVHTRRPVVLTAGFHGWHDWQLQYQGGSDVAGRDPETVDFGYDLDRLARELHHHRGRVAAVFVTPEITCMPLEDLRVMQDMARAAGALFILDEVITGFRVAGGGLHGHLGLTPDLLTISKGLCNGVALSAVMGRQKVMRAQEDTYLGNTFMREVAPFAGALVSVTALRDGATSAICDATATLVPRLDEVLERHGVRARVVGREGVFHVLFANLHDGQDFYAELRARGVHAEAGGTHLVCAALGAADIDQAIVAFEQVAIARSASDVGAPTRRRLDEAAFATFAWDAFRAGPAVAARWWALHPRLGGAAP